MQKKLFSAQLWMLLIKSIYNLTVGKPHDNGNSQIVFKLPSNLSNLSYVQE